MNPIPRLRPLRGQSPSPLFAPTGSERIGIFSAAPPAAVWTFVLTKGSTNSSAAPAVCVSHSGYIRKQGKRPVRWRLLHLGRSANAGALPDRGGSVFAVTATARTAGIAPTVTGLPDGSVCRGLFQVPEEEKPCSSRENGSAGVGPATGPAAAFARGVTVPGAEPRCFSPRKENYLPRQE